MGEWVSGCKAFWSRLVTCHQALTASQGLRLSRDHNDVSTLADQHTFCVGEELG